MLHPAPILSLWTAVVSHPVFGRNPGILQWNVAVSSAMVGKRKQTHRRSLISRWKLTPFFARKCFTFGQK
jgi:hypothetical protein